MADSSMDMGGVSMTISGDALANALLPHLVKSLATNATLQDAIVAAIMPGIRAQMATLARSTAGAGTTTNRSGMTPT